MRVCVILNPWADRGRARLMQEQIVAWGTAHGGLDMRVTDAPGRAQTLAAELAADYDVIAAAGGDGTANEVANGLFLSGRAESTRFGLIPIGSGNDYAFSLGLLDTPQQAVQRLFTGQPRPVDIATIQDEHGRRRVVTNGIGIGFDAAVAIESLKITRIYGFALYVLATLRTMLFRFHTPNCRFQFDDNTTAQGTLLLAVGVGQRVGGGFYLTPSAIMDDGLLDTCLVNPVNRLTMLILVLRAMKGQHVTSRHVAMGRSRRITLQANRPLPIHTDGEIFAFLEDNVRQLTIEVVPAGLHVMA